MTATRTERPGDRRETILDAATALFSESGARGTSIAAVAARAGITDAGVLYHFNTKKELELAVLERFDRDVDRSVAESELFGIHLLQAMREWGAAMEEIPEIQSMLIMLSAENLHHDSPARTYVQRRYQRVLDRYRVAFTAAAEAGHLRPDLDPDHEASAFVAHLDGIRFQWFLSDRTFSMAESVRHYVDATLERLAPPRGKGRR